MERLLILFHKLALHPLPHGSKNYFVFIKFSLSERIFYFVYFVYTINSETMYKRLLINGSKIAANFSPMSTLILHV